MDEKDIMTEPFDAAGAPQQASPIPPAIPDVSQPGTLLVDWYRATVATNGGDNHSEYVISTLDGENVTLDHYEKESPYVPETQETFTVPKKLLDDCMKMIDDYHLRDWERLGVNMAMCGGVRVIKFRDGDKYVRITQDRAVPAGIEVFYEMEALFRDAVRKAKGL